MNIQPYSGKTTRARKAFFDQVHEAVRRIQKVAGANITIDEHPQGTVINAFSGGAGGGGGGGGIIYGACCLGSICAITTEGGCTGVWHMGMGCGGGFCASFLPPCNTCGFPEFIPSTPPRKFLVKSFVGLWAVATGSCASGGMGGCPDCSIDYSFDYLWTRFYDENCHLQGEVDTCSGTNVASCAGGYDPVLCGGFDGSPFTPGVATGPDGMDICAWNSGPSYYSNCDLFKTVNTITEATQQTTVTNYVDTGPSADCNDPGVAGNTCSGSRTDAIILSDECRIT